MNRPNYQVLIVDDEAHVRQLTARALEGFGIACDQAADGATAEELAASHDYDVVVTDLRMPRQNGHRLAVQLLSLTPSPLVLVLTGVIEPRLARDLLARGVKDVMHKPIDYGLLATKVKALVDQRRATVESGTDGKPSSVAEAGVDDTPGRASEPGVGGTPGRASEAGVDDTPGSIAEHHSEDDDAAGHPEATADTAHSSDDATAPAASLSARERSVGASAAAREGRARWLVKRGATPGKLKLRRGPARASLTAPVGGAPERPRDAQPPQNAGRSECTSDPTQDSDARRAGPARFAGRGRLQVGLSGSALAAVLAVAVIYAAAQLVQASQQRRLVQALESLGAKVSTNTAGGIDVDLRGRNAYAGLRDLDRLGRRARVHSISLGGSDVADRDLVLLHHLRELRSLSLADTTITDGAIPHLRELRHLRQLDLAGTRVSAAGVAQLERALPEAVIRSEWYRSARPLRPPRAWRPIPSDAPPPGSASR